MLVVAVAICFVIFAGYLYCRFHQLRHVAKMSRRSDNKTDLRLSAYNFIDRVLLWFASRYRSIIVKLKIIVATYQIITAVPNVLSVTMPSSFTSFLHGMNFVNLSFVSLLSLQCSSHFNFIDKLIISTLVPIGIVLLLFVAFVLHIVYIAKEVNKNPHRKVGDARALYDAAKDQYLNYFFYLTYLILPSVTTRIFQTFLCTNIDPDNENPDDDNYYLTADMSISCSSAYYHRGVAYAIFMIFVYPIGITSMYAYLLYTHHVEIRDRQLKTEERRGLLDPPSDVESPDTGSDTMNNSPSAVELEAGRGSVIQHTDNPMLMSTVDNSKRAEEAPQTEDRSDQSRPERTVSTATSIAGVSTSGRSNRFGMSAPAARLAFLWGAYEPVYWYWELIETSRRLMLTAVLSATGAGTSKQAVLALLLALMYIKLYAYFSPYEQTPSNTTAEIGQYQILFSFLGALVVMESLLGSGYNSTVGGLLILFNLGVVTAFSYYEIRDLLAERAEEREANDEKIARSSDVVNVSSGGASNDVEIEMTDVANDN